MDLLGQESIKKPQSKGKKIVLILLIISIILLIVAIAMIYLLKGSTKKALTLNVNSQKYGIAEDMLVTSEQGVTYISIEGIAKLIGYDYFKGGYLEYEENNNKGYIENAEQIVKYEADSNRIYKINKISNIDDEYYDLKNKITKLNEKLYIALEDLNVGCNVIYSYSEQENTIKIDTVENWLKKNQEKLDELEVKADDDTNNSKALLYNMIVVSSKNSQKMGVINREYSTVIGYKYKSMNFDEFSHNFIVSEQNGFGVISKEGRGIIEPRYDSIEIINYSPLLYKVKLNNKYGIFDENGKIKINIEYDEIGFNQRTNLIEPVTIIKNLENKQDGIIVCKGRKYGICNIKTGEMILNCEVDKIYTKLSNSEKKEYYVELENTEIELNRYIEYVNTVTVVTN